MKFQIIGMRCAACAARIEKNLKSLPGVSSATVNFALETATIKFRDQELPAAEIIEKINQLCITKYLQNFIDMSYCM